MLFRSKKFDIISENLAKNIRFTNYQSIYRKPDIYFPVKKLYSEYQKKDASQRSVIPGQNPKILIEQIATLTDRKDQIL